MAILTKEVVHSFPTIMVVSKGVGLAHVGGDKAGLFKLKS